MGIKTTTPKQPEALSVFQYASARRFLLDAVEQKQKQESKFSIRQWAKDMGMSSHVLMVLVLQGKRNLTLKQVPFLSKGLNLSTPERMYFQALIQMDQAKSPEEKELCSHWMQDLNPGRILRVREVDEYRVISHWVHMAILSMTELKDFTGTPEEIHSRLGGKVTLLEVRSALERLKELKLITLKNGVLKATFHQVTTKDDVANRGVRAYHQQVAQLAADAVEAQSIDEREFQSFAISVPKNKIQLAKSMIRKFRTQFAKAMSSEPGDDVYQTNLHFFKLTEKPKEKI